MKETEETRRARLKRLKSALAKGEADIAGGRATILESGQDIADFFANL